MEGGYTDDPHDPGGPTNLGITLAELAEWRGTAIGPDNRESLIAALKALDSTTARDIYRQRYWQPAGCDALPAPLALMHFDAAVNHGVSTAIRILQEAVHAGVDGEIGPETMAAVSATPLMETLDRYAAIRERRYRALPHFWRFGRGWLRRVAATLALARRIAGETPNPSEGDTDMTTTPADDVTEKWWGHSITIWGSIITVLSTVLPALAPVTGIDVSGDLVQSAGQQVVEAIQAVGALAGTLMTIYGRVRATQPIGKALFKSKG
jgi:lysozyme family protein